MAPKEGGGILATVIRRFQAGELDISVESALNKVPQCTKFLSHGGCNTRCKKIHLDKQGKLRPSVGLHIACELERDPASKPGVHVDPVLALQAFLLANGSPLIIDHMYNREGAFVFRFAEQHVSPVVKTIARQKWVRIDVGGDERTLNATDEVAPTLVLHCVKQDSLQSSLDILVKGFNYGEVSKPFGIYTVDATSEQQSGAIASYDGGAAIVLKPTGFVANISSITSGGKPRENCNWWVTGAPPGVILFRRMASKLKEYILHRDSVQFAYISMEQTLFEPWAREYAVGRPEGIRAAHLMRRDWKAGAGVVLPSGDELSINCDTAQTMAGSEPFPRALTVAQPRPRSRSRSRSRSVPRPADGVGVEIQAPAVLLERSGLGRVAATDLDGGMPGVWERSFHQRAFERPRDPERYNIASETDRRLTQFVPSSVRYLAQEYDEMTQGAAASSSGRSCGSSLSAARSLLQETRAESIAVVQAQEPWAQPCEGPGCNERMSHKSEWKRYYSHYYCHSCYGANNLVTQENRAESIVLHERAVVEETVAPVQVVQAQEPWARSCEGPGCNARMSSRSQWRKYYNHYYCHRCYDANNVVT